MKLSKSVLLSIALFGASASIFSYAAVYDVRGDDANALGNQFKSYLARAVNGDEIVLHNNVNLLRETGKLDIPNITIRSTNNSRLHIVGANLNLTGSAKFKDLNLSLRPDSGLNASFSGIVSGPDAMPTFIITNGNSLTLDNVNTKVDGDNDGTRPIILVGGGNSGENEVLTITNSKNESKFHSIIVDSTKKLNDAGNNFANNDSRSEKEITINLDANSRVLNELNLAGIDKSQSPNNKISINSETLNIGNFGNSSKDGIRIGGAKNVNLTFSNVKNNLQEVKFVDDANINLKTLVLDGAEIVLKKDTNIGTLELKNEAKFNVESIPDPEGYGNDINFNVKVTTLKTDGKTNTLDIAGNSSINVDALDGEPSHLNVTGIANNFKLKDNSKYDYVPNGTRGEFLPSVDELPPEETTPGNGEVDAKPADDPNAIPSEPSTENSNTEEKPSKPTEDTGASNGTETLEKDKPQPSTPDSTSEPNAGTNEAGTDTDGAEKPNLAEEEKDKQEQPNDTVGTTDTDTSTPDTSNPKADGEDNSEGKDKDQAGENAQGGDTKPEAEDKVEEKVPDATAEPKADDKDNSESKDKDQVGENAQGNDKAEGVAESESKEPKQDGSEAAEQPKDDKVDGAAESKPEEPKQDGSEVAEKPKEPSNPSVNEGEEKADEGEQADKPTETPKEKSAEKNTKDHIMDTLKGLFTKNNLTEKQQQQVVEKTEESLNDLVEMYTDYDFSFSLDAVRVAENRLNQLAMLNGLESAANDNYAFLAQSARALKTHNSIWVSSSLAEQRGDTKRRLHSINLGYDEQLGNLLFGTFVSYLHQKAERGELRSKLHGYAFSVYGKYSQDAHEVVAMLNVGRTKADLQRNISALGVSNQADAKSKFVGLKVEYGYRIPFEAYNLQVKPLVGLRYNFGRQAAFTEQGTMPVHVDQIKAQRLAVEAGVELKKYFETAYIYAKPTIQTDLMAHSNDVDVRFVDTPNSIPFKSATKKKTYFALSLGTQVQLRKNLLLDLSANNRIGHNERDIQGNIKLSYKF